MKIKVVLHSDSTTKVWLLEGTNKICVSEPFWSTGIANSHAFQLGQLLKCPVEFIQKVPNTLTEKWEQTDNINIYDDGHKVE